MFKKADIVLYVLLAAAAAATALLLYTGEAAGDTVIVRINGEIYGNYALSEDRTVILPGEHNILVIESGNAYMRYADCPDQSCIRQGRISRAGEAVVCLPNRVTFEIRAKKEPVVDAVVQ